MTEEQIITLASSFGSAIIGGFIAGYFAIKATKQSFKNQKAQEESAEERIAFGLLQAIFDEIDTLWERYSSTMGCSIDSLKENEALLTFYPISSDYFPVYRGNTVLISRIKSNDLRKAIVSTYTKATGMIDSFRMNNELVGKVEYWNQLHQQTREESHLQIAQANYQRCVTYAKQIKESHRDLKDEVSKLLRLLHKQGVLTEKQ